MYQVQEKTLQKALQILDALQCKYVVIDSNNNKYGTLNVIEKTKRSPRLYPFGEIKSYLEPYLGNIQIGEVVEVPYGKYGGAKVQCHAAGFMCTKFGVKTHTSSQNHARQVLEVLRLQ